MGPVREFTSDNWEDQVLSGPSPVLVDLVIPEKGPCGEKFHELETYLQGVGEKVTVGILDLSRILTLDQASWLQEAPTLLFLKKGRIIRSFSGKDRMARMGKWLSLVEAWSPAFFDR